MMILGQKDLRPQKKQHSRLQGETMTSVPAAELPSYIGKELGRSEWLTIDQDRINQFAECTGDHQFIHVDPEKAKLTPFGSTIAHGFLSLSLVPKLMEGIMIMPAGLKMAVNYGLDSVRFIQPVKVNSKVRLVVNLTDAHEKNPGQWLLKAKVVLEIEGSEKPAYIAEPLTLCFV
jgi:acyl dehydratase